MSEEQVRQDRQTVNSAGQSLERLPEGVGLRDVRIHIDKRGSVREMFDLRWKLKSNRIPYKFDRPRSANAPSAQ